MLHTLYTFYSVKSIGLAADPRVGAGAGAGTGGRTGTYKFYFFR